MKTLALFLLLSTPVAAQQWQTDQQGRYRHQIIPDAPQFAPQQQMAPQVAPPQQYAPQPQQQQRPITVMVRPPILIPLIRACVLRREARARPMQLQPYTAFRLVPMR